MRKLLVLIAILCLTAVPLLAYFDDNLDSICQTINCSEAPGLPMAWSVQRLGKSNMYRLQATIFDSVDSDFLNTIFRDPYSPSDPGYSFETLLYGREIVWQDWMDAEGPQTRFHEVGNQIVRGPGPGHTHLGTEMPKISGDPPAISTVAETSGDAPRVSTVPESGTLVLLALGLLAVSGMTRRFRYRVTGRLK